MKNFITILVLISLIATASAQTRIDLGVVAIPSLSTINTEGKSNAFDYLVPFNFGIKTNISWKKFIFSTGVLYFVQGTKFTVTQTNPNQPEIITGTYDVYIRAKAIVIPINLDYILLSKNKTEISAGLGLYAGYIYSQQQENTSIPENYQPPSNVIYLIVPTRFTNVNYFDNNYWGGNVGIGIRHSINDHWSYLLRPNFLYQFRKELTPPTQYDWTNRLTTFSLDIGLYYNIGKKATTTEKNDTQIERTAPPE